MNTAPAIPLKQTITGSAGNPTDRMAAATHTLSGLSRRLVELNLADSHSILFFGSRAQAALTDVSDRMLEQVRSKDAGPAGAALNDMVLTLRGFDIGAAADARPAGWFGRLLGRGANAARLLQRYEDVRGQVEAIMANLQRHQTALLVDIETLDRLYDANLTYVRELEAFIEAGVTALQTLDTEVIPEAMAAAGHEAADTIAAQQLRDLRTARDALDRRVHDLRLTRQVAMQALPSIRLVQENDKSLVSKIDSTLVNTVPLWRQQLAQAVSIQRSRDAAQAVAAANDLTNELLRANAEALRSANRETRQQVERGVFDIEAIGAANRVLIDTIEDSLQIAEEGRAARAKVVGELQQMESALKKTLAAARSAATTTAMPSPGQSAG